jgi:hypothetical protein
MSNKKSTLSETHPDIAAEWDYEANQELGVLTVSLDFDQT